MMTESVFQLKVTLKGIRPPIWRRLLVPSDFTLEDLHEVIQSVMPWTDSHLHAFEQGSITYGIPHADDWPPLDFDSSEVSLAEVLSSPKDKITYVYDFGDDWRHEIRLEKILPEDPDVIYPVCTAGKRACPPEDCGGQWGYAEMLQAIRQPEHPGHDMYVEWLGYDFDPEEFDLDEANFALSDFSEDDELPLLPINRHLVIMTPTQVLIELIHKYRLPDLPPIALDDLLPFVFLAPILPDVADLQSFVNELRSMLITFHLATLGVDIEQLSSLPTDAYDAWYEVKMFPLVYDISGLGPVMHFSQDLLEAFLDEE